MPNSILYEVRISLPQTAALEAEIISDYLINCGIAPDTIVEKVEHSRRFLSVYCSTADESKRIFKQMRTLKLDDLLIEQKTVKQEDWIDKWKDDFKPFVISKRFEVVPAWLKEKHKTSRGKTPLYIDTSVAFGTGMHETTQFMVQLIERCQGRFDSFLDIGTGTGILAMAGFHCGAKSVLGIDICSDAVKIAQENLALNGIVSSKNIPVKMMTKDIQKFSRKDTFDFVAANLVTHDLKVNARAIVGLVNSGGYLAVSGVSIPNCCTFRETFDAFPLKCVKILKGETWMAFLYKKL